MKEENKAYREYVNICGTKQYYMVYLALYYQIYDVLISWV